MKTKPLRTKKYVSKLVERGLQVQNQLVILHAMHRGIIDELKAEAAARTTEHIPFVAKDGEGSQWIALGETCECRIIFPAPQLRTTLDASQPSFLNVKTLAGNHFNSLFRKATFFVARDKKTFRGQVSNLLSPEIATQLLDLCSGPYEPQVMWESFAGRKAKQ